MAKKDSGGRKSTKTRGAHKPASPAGGGRRRFTLSNLKPPAGSRRKKVRVGGRKGPTLGKPAGPGNKGQKSRRGYSRRRGFEGGQMPLHRRMPKRGFHNPFGVTYSILNLEELNVFPAGGNRDTRVASRAGFLWRTAH